MHDLNPASPEPEVVSGGDSGQASSGKRVCSACRTVNGPEALYCYKCGLRLPDELQSGKRVCSACRTVNEPEALYCYKCGLRLPDEIRFGAESIGPPAGFWIRFVAHLIDHLFLGIISFVISVIVISFWVETSADGELYLVYVIVPAYMWWIIGITLALEAIYFTVAIGAWGRTIGKAMLGIMVVRRDGSRVSYARSLARCLLYLIQIEFLLGISFLMIAFDDEKQGIHDVVCDTRVVKV